MAKQSISANDFTFNLVIRIDARNCRQLVIKVLAGIAALTMVANKMTVWLAAMSR